MIYIIDNGMGFEDLDTLYVDAPLAFERWWLAVFKPWLDEYRRNLEIPVLLGVASTIRWIREPSTMDIAGFTKWSHDNLDVRFADGMRTKRLPKPLTCPEFHGWTVRSSNDEKAAVRLGDCRGFVEAVNEACACGGAGPGEVCPACEVYHAVKDFEVLK